MDISEFYSKVTVELHPKKDSVQYVIDDAEVKAFEILAELFNPTSALYTADAAKTICKIIKTRYDANRFNAFTDNVYRAAAMARALPYFLSKYSEAPPAIDDADYNARYGFGEVKKKLTKQDQIDFLTAENQKLREENARLINLMQEKQSQIL